MQTDARRAAIESANVAIRAILLVNGGAVVALLALIGAMEASNSATVSLGPLVEPVWWFAIGTGISALTAAFAYLVNMLDSDILSSVNLIWKHPYVEEKPLAQRLFRLRQLIHIGALVLVILSFVTFFLGIFSVTSAIQQLGM